MPWWLPNGDNILWDRNLNKRPMLTIGLPVRTGKSLNVGIDNSSSRNQRREHRTKKFISTLITLRSRICSKLLEEYRDDIRGIFHHQTSKMHISANNGVPGNVRADGARTRRVAAQRHLAGVEEQVSLKRHPHFPLIDKISPTCTYCQEKQHTTFEAYATYKNSREGEF